MLIQTLGVGFVQRDTQCTETVLLYNATGICRVNPHFDWFIIKLLIEFDVIGDNVSLSSNINSSVVFTFEISALDVFEGR